LIKNDYDVPKNEADFPSWVQEEGRLDRLHKLLLEDKEGAEVTPDFSVFQRELLGDVKKKPSGDGGSTPTEQLALPVGALPETETEFAAQPQVLPLGYQLPGAPLPDAEQAADAEQMPTPALEEATPFAPGSPVAPMALNQPNFATGELAAPRLPAQEESDFLNQLPADPDPGVRPDNSEYQRTPYGKELVAIPNDYTGAVPPETFQLQRNGHNDATQYFYRDKSKKVDGQEQSYGDAIKGKIKNALYGMGQGVLEGAGALENAIMGTGGGPGAQFYDAGATQASEAVEQSKTPIAPYYQQEFGKHQNWETLGLAAADYAPLVIAQVAQTLAPELRAPAALQKALGLATATAFDADMYHAAHEHAKQIFPDDPRKADLYTLFEGTLTVAGFKAGSKLMTQLGDKLAYKVSPFSLKRTVAADAVERLSQLEASLGRAASQAERQQVLHDSLRAALPKLAQIPKEALQQAGTFGGVEAAKIIGNAAAAPALGGEADNLDAPGEGLLSRIGRAALGGATMGAITGGVGAVLPTTQLVGSSRPAEAAPPTIDPAERFDIQVENLDPVARPAAQPVQDAAQVVAAASAPEPTQPEAAPAPELAPELAPVTPSPEPSPAAPAGEVVPSPAAPVERAALPEAAPEAASVKPLTPQQQATNDTLDALDRYNALDARATKGKAGSAIRAEISAAAQKAGLTATVKADFSMSVTRDGKRATRYNEYTATTPAANHVPLESRPTEARPFMDSVLSQAEADPRAIQGMGIKVRGKELSARELAGAVEDIRAGKNTLRAQLVLDTLETAHQRGYVEKSEGTGLATRKFTVPVEDYIGDTQPSGTERAISDSELNELAAQDPRLAEAIATYTNPETGEIDYASLAEHGGRGALETFFDVTPELATQAVALANERARNPRPAQPAASSPETNASPAQGRSQPDSLPTGSPGLTPVAEPAAREAAPALTQAPDTPAEATGERAHAKRYTDETQAGLTADERKYTPAEAKIAANESPAAFIKRAGPEAAYEAAIGEPTTEALLHDNLVRGVAEHYTEARNAALKAGDTATADAAQERIMRLVGALSKSGTEQAQALQARVGAGGTVGDLMRAKDPAATGRATVDAALGEIANSNAEAQRQNNADAAEIEQQAKPKRQRKMTEVLETKTVKAAIEKAAGTSTPPTEAAPADKTGYGDSNKFFTKDKITEWRKQLKSMAFSAPLPAESILLGAYHLEASTRKFADWSAKMLREAGTRIRPRLSELYELSKAELLKKDPTASGFNTPEEVAAIVGRQQAPGAVREGVNALNKRLSDIAKQHASDTNTDRRTLTKKFIEDAGLSGRVAGEVAAAIEREWSQRVEKASWQVLRGRFQPKRTRAKLDALSRLVNDLNAASNLPETTMRSPVAQLLEQLIGNNVPVSAAEARHIEALKEAYIKAAKKTPRTIAGAQVETQDTKAVAKAALDMLGAIGKLKNANQQDWTRDLGAMFYASILSNPSTHAANAYLNTISTGHEVGFISTIHTAADAGLAQAAKPLLALFPGYKRGAADAYEVAATGIDLKSKVGDSLGDKDFQSDPLEEHSVVRSRLLAGLQKLGIGRSWQAPEKSAARVVRRSLGASDTFFQGGLAEARAKEIAVKTAVRAVEQRQAAGVAMTAKEVRQFVADETDRLLFNTPAALADIKAIVASEGLGSPKTVAEAAARNARIGDLLDQARATVSPELVADSKEFAARHAGNSEYEGHLGRFAYALAETFKGVPVVGKIIVPFAKVTSNFQNRYAEWAGLGFYRAVQGGAGKPVFGKFGEIDKRFVREYTPEEQEKAFLRSTIGTLVGMSSYALVKAGYIAITGMASGNKDEDQQRPAQSIIFLKGPLAGTSFSYKGMNEEIALSTLAQTMSWAEKKKLVGDDPDVTDRMEAVALITAASTMNLGPSNGAGDFLGTISKVNQNPEAWFKAVERMGMTGAKSMLMPAGVTYAANLLNQATDASLPQKQSNDAWEQFKLQVWGDVPAYLGGPDKQDALDIFGDPMKYASNRFWGTRPLNDDPRKAEIKLLLVDKGIMPDEIRISDRRLRLYDPTSGTKATPLTNKEYRDFCEARGKAFYRELTEDGEFRLNDIRQATTQKAAAKVRNQALKTATDEARTLIETRRAASGAAAQFKAK
jgi:hypothetical protein